MLLNERLALGAERDHSVVRGGEGTSPHQIVHREIDDKHGTSAEKHVRDAPAALR